MSYIVDLESFHGPLDLLLFLIEKNQVDIYDIPVSQISDQFILYLENTGDFDLEKMGQFLLMASYLLNLKAKMLLPVRNQESREEEEDPEDPRTELVRQLLHYKQFKEAAEQLLARQNGELPRVYYRPADTSQWFRQEISLNVRALCRAYEEVVKQKQYKYLIPQEDVDVAEKMDQILAVLSSGKEVVFQSLFDHVVSRKEVFALFLALLELIRLHKVEAVQEEPSSVIKIRLRVEN
ncbi:MAG: segregation and condensation protein A [Syntrophomonadaceae bacterium]|jgi:segregation and condensation protein A